MMASLNDIEAKVQNIIDILSGGIVTGILPLTLTKHTAGNVIGWEIFGNDNVGKNLLPITTGSFTDNGVTFTFDAETGIVVANGKATGGQGRYAFYIEPTETLNLYLSGCPEGGSASTYNIYPWDSTANARPKKWDGTTSQMASDYGTGGLEVQAAAGHILSATIRIEEGYTADNLVFKPMYRLSDTSAYFEPYQIGVGEQRVDGYYVPLTISQAGQTDKTVDIFIGDSPLTEGETVSKTSTGVDIELFEGENTISTTIYNKPKMTIKI